MSYLLDVSALIALGFEQHPFHPRVAAWVIAKNFPRLITCSITELGFIRVLSQVRPYGLSVMETRRLLAHLKKSEILTFSFIADGNGVNDLPVWVKTARQTTDGHLVELAARNGVTLATLDSKIPGSHHIQ